MKRKKVSKLFLIAGIIALLTNIQSYATEEIMDDIVPTETEIVENITEPEIEIVEEEVLPEDDIITDTIPPVFDSNIQTRYVIQRDDTGRGFIPEEWIKDVKATDDVDGEDVEISLQYNGVDLARDGEYYISYIAKDKSGNESFLGITVIVDGTGPIFAEDTEKLYYIGQDGIILDSKYNPVVSLPETITATDSVGAFAGIGVCMITGEDGNVVFCSTIENTPAAEVLQPNDILLEVNGEDMRGKSTAYVSTKVKGEVGTDVTLKILRNGEEMTITITRAIVKLYEDEEFLAKPTVEIDSIDRKSNGTIEITYVATDEAGNTTEFVVTVVVDENLPMLYVDDKKVDDEEEEDISDIPSDTPPEEVETSNVDEEEEEENEDVVIEDSESYNEESKQDEEVDNEEDTILDEEQNNEIEEKQEKEQDENVTQL